MVEEPLDVPPAVPVPCVRLRPGVRLDGLAPAGIRILASVDNAAKLLACDLEVTSAVDGHVASDPHTAGRALDISIRGLGVSITLKLLTYLEQVLGSRFTVLLETPIGFIDPRLQARQTVNPGASGPHIHAQLKKGLTSFPPAPTPVAGR